MNHAPEAIDSARAYVAERWGEAALVRAIAIATVEIGRLRQWSTTNAWNERYATARTLRAHLEHRGFRAAVAHAQRLAKEAGRPLIAEARALREALDALARKVEGLAESAATFGGAADLRATAKALEDYTRAPTAARRRKLDAVVQRPGIEARAAIVAAVQAVVKVDRSPTTWAVWAIAIELEAPCDSEALERLRRRPWRLALRCYLSGRAAARSRARPI